MNRAKILQQQLLLKEDLKNRMDKGEEPHDV